MSRRYRGTITRDRHRWRVRVWIDGARETLGTYETRERAESVLAAWLEQHEEKPTGLTLGGWGQHWLDEREKDGRHRTPSGDGFRQRLPTDPPRSGRRAPQRPCGARGRRHTLMLMTTTLRAAQPILATFLLVLAPACGSASHPPAGDAGIVDDASSTPIDFTHACVEVETALREVSDRCAGIAEPSLSCPYYTTPGDCGTWADVRARVEAVRAAACEDAVEVAYGGEFCG